MKSFWQKLKTPFSVLAPMYDITDPAFRKIVASLGKPDVFYTEFISADGICSRGQKALAKHLKFSKKEKPIVAQFFGANPDNFYQAAQVAVKLGFDGIDINMGCPDAAVQKQGAGASLIKNPILAGKIIQATMKGAGKLPVSVKTRIGWAGNEVSTWIPQILACKPAALTIHGRTKKDSLKVGFVNWSAIAEAAELAKKSGIIVVGNGDISSCQQGRELAVKYNLDGFMIGRAIIGNPWLFNKNKKNITLEDRLQIIVKHSKLFEKQISKPIEFMRIKKHLAAYATGFDQAKQLRISLMRANNSQEVEEITRSWACEKYKNQL